VTEAAAESGQDLGRRHALRRLLRTNAFRLAALYLTLFATSVLALLAFIYWSTANFVEQQTEATLDAEIAGLAEQYAQRGLSGLVQVIAERSAGERGDAMIYLLTDPRSHPLAGNLSAWPDAEVIRPGWLGFPVEIKRGTRQETHPARGATFTACSSAAICATPPRSAVASPARSPGPGCSPSASASPAVSSSAATCCAASRR
jgi:hypothetical protein